MDGFFLVSRRINFLVVRHSDGLVRWRAVPGAGERIPLNEVFSADPRNKLARRIELGKNSLADQDKTSKPPQRRVSDQLDHRIAQMNTDKRKSALQVPNPKLQIPNRRSNPKFQMKSADKPRDLFRFGD
jgi:hypothetical protein